VRLAGGVGKKGKKCDRAECDPSKQGDSKALCSNDHTHWDEPEPDADMIKRAKAQATTDTKQLGEAIETLLRTMPIKREEVWGVQATFDRLLKNQGIFVGIKQEIADNKEDWEKMLKLALKPNKREQEVRTDRAEEEKIRMRKDLNVRAQISPQQELKLKSAIDDMKEKILTLVDLAHEKAKERECKELKLDGHGSFLHMAWNVFISVFVLAFLTVVIMSIVHFGATGISGLCPLVCLCMYARACAHLISHSLSFLLMCKRSMCFAH